LREDLQRLLGLFPQSMSAISFPNAGPQKPNNRNKLKIDFLDPCGKCAAAEAARKPGPRCLLVEGKRCAARPRWEAQPIARGTAGPRIMQASQAV